MNNDTYQPLSSPFALCSAFMSCAKILSRFFSAFFLEDLISSDVFSIVTDMSHYVAL